MNELLTQKEEYNHLRRSSTNLENSMKNRFTQDLSEMESLKRKYKKLELSFQTVIDDNKELEELVKQYEQRIFNYQ